MASSGQLVSFLPPQVVKLMKMIPVINILAAIGAFRLSHYVLGAAQLFHQFFLRRSSFPKYLSSDPASPSWALVTGASDGIGRGFAYELCFRGMNVILHGRNETKLLNLKAALLESFPGRGVEIAVADAALYDDGKAMAAMVELASNLPDGGRLRVLVNNVGGAHALIGQGIFYRLEDTTLDEIDILLNVNARFPARLTTALLPVLTSDSNSPSLIINIGSIASVSSLPYTVVYNGVKAFNLSFSQGLREELNLEGHDVEVLGVLVGSVDTAGAPATDQDAGLSIQPRKMAKHTLDSVGCGKAVIFSHWRHWMQKTLMGLVPQSVITNTMHKYYLEERNKK